MRGFVASAILSILAISPEVVMAQPSPQSEPSAAQVQPTLVPGAVGQPRVVEGGHAAATATAPGKPADLCREVLAFVRAPSPSTGAAAAAQPSPQNATAVQAPSQSSPVPMPDAAGGVPQQASGMSAQVTPSGPGASSPQGAAQSGSGSPPSGQSAGTAPASQPAGPPPSSTQQSVQGAQPPAQSAPAAASAAAPPSLKPTMAHIEKAETAARDHSLQGCRDVAQEMRRAGITMPAPLLALAALDLKFF